MQRTSLAEESKRANRFWLLWGLILSLGGAFITVAISTSDPDLLSALWRNLQGFGLPTLGGLFMLWRYFFVLSSGIHPSQIAIDKERRGASRELDAELRAGYSSLGKNALLTQNWLFIRRLSSWDAFELKDLVWAYLKETIVYSSRMGYEKDRLYHAELAFGRNGGLKFDQDGLYESAVQNFLLDMKERAPWASYGYSDEIKDRWEKHREALIRDVRQKRDTSAGTNAPHENKGL